ncbi:MAG: hypothetical protein JXA73_08980 [Acidobacteria bacterium]|nr:hypothetical protein [Acidobacteriota bacterium]
MTGQEAAQALRRIANGIERFEHIPWIKREVLDEDCQAGAAAMLMFLRDLMTVAGKELFTRDEILVLLNNLQNDKEIFSVDLITLMGME